MDQDGLFQKHAKLCPNLAKACSVSGFALLLKEEPCPLKPSKGFLNNPSWSLKFYFYCYHGILDASNKFKNLFIKS